MYHIVRNITILLLTLIIPLSSFSQSEFGSVSKKLNYQIVNFSRNLELLANTNYEKNERGYNERIILNQFIDRNAKLEVTDLNQNTIKEKTVQEYLNELIDETAKIAIEIRDIQINENEFKQVNKDKIICYVRYVQSFKKHVDGELTYHDITKKIIKAQAIKTMVDPSDSSFYAWDIKFINIGIERIKNVLTGTVYEIQETKEFFEGLNPETLINKQRIERKLNNVLNIAIPDSAEFNAAIHAKLESDKYKAIPGKLTDIIEVERNIALSTYNINIPANCIDFSLNKNNAQDIIYAITLTPNDIKSVLNRNTLIYDNVVRDDMSLEFLINYFGEYINILSKYLSTGQIQVIVTGKADAIPVQQCATNMYNFMNSNTIKSNIYSYNYNKDTTITIQKDGTINNQGLAFIRAYKTKEYLSKIVNYDNISLKTEISDEIKEKDRGVEIELVFKNGLQKTYNSIQEKSKEIIGQD